MGDDDYDVIEETPVEGEDEAGRDPDAADEYEEVYEDAGTEGEGEGSEEEAVRRPQKTRRAPRAPAKAATPVWVWVLAGGGALVAVAAVLAVLHARETGGPVMTPRPPVQSAPAPTPTRAQGGAGEPVSPITFVTAGAPASAEGTPLPASLPSAPGTATAAPAHAAPTGTPIAGTAGGSAQSPSGSLTSPSAAVSGSSANPAQTAATANGSSFPGQGAPAPAWGGVQGLPVNVSAGTAPAPPAAATGSGAATLEATLRANLASQRTMLKSILSQLKALRTSLHHHVSTHRAAPAGLVLRLREQRDTAWRQIRALSEDRDALRLQVARLKERLRLASTDRRIFQGWRLIGVSNSAAILRNGRGSLRVLTPGHTFGGVKILAIDAVNLSVRTSAGRIPLPAIALP